MNTVLYPNPHPAGCPWHSATEIFGAPNIKWCESTICSWISEPANTWSNLLYIVFAVIIFFQLRKSADYELKWMGPAMFLMGLFSLVYHASNFYITQLFDFVGMFLFVFWLLVINLRRAGIIKRERQVAVFVALGAVGLALVHGMYIAQLKFQIIVAIAAVAIAATEYLARRKSPGEVRDKLSFPVALLFLIVAQISSLLDANRILCEPDHWLQGHAVWHILAAIGLYFAVRHYRQFDYSK